jgi:hypothetical protein
MSVNDEVLACLKNGLQRIGATIAQTSDVIDFRLWSDDDMRTLGECVEECLSARGCNSGPLVGYFTQLEQGGISPTVANVVSDIVRMTKAVQ